jgi:hypothetical protein
MRWFVQFQTHLFVVPNLLSSSKHLRVSRCGLAKPVGTAALFTAVCFVRRRDARSRGRSIAQVRGAASAIPLCLAFPQASAASTLVLLGG